MIIFLYGPDIYHRQKKLKEIVSQYQKKNSALTVENFDLEEENDWLKLKEFLTAGSLFGDKKMAVIENCIAPSDKKESIFLYKSFLENKDSILLLTSSEERLIKDFLFLEKKPVVFQKFEILTGAAWKKFIDQEIKKRELVLNLDIRNLTSDLEGDCFALVNELEKASLSNGKLSADGQSNSYQFFDLIRELAGGNFAKKLSALELLLENEDSAKIFNLLASFSRNKKSIFADYDFFVKSGKLEYEEILLDYLIT